jgi:Cd2+/Zn2+-exporting ATPase
MITVLALKNMDCADCAAKLERKVRELPGVSEAQVNIISAKITVRHTEHEAAIRGLIARQGYLAAESESFWRDSRTLATLIAAMFFFLGMFLPDNWSRWLIYSAILAGGFFPARSGLRTLIYNRAFDINFLMTVAVLGAIVIGELGEAATVVLLFALSHALEAFTMGRTRRSIHNLMDLAPDTAWIEVQGELQSVPSMDIKAGQEIVIKPGERIAVDGEVISGISEVNQSQVTGESMPVTRGPGDGVFAGSVNGSGVMVVRSTKSASESTLARIVAMVEEAATSRPPVQQFVDKFARWYTPLVISLAASVATVSPLFMGAQWEPWIYRGLALLVVACPCALVISTPVSIVSALGNAARRGVLIKNGAALERAAGINIIAMDKTGTLTKGMPRLVSIRPASGHSQTEILSLAAIVEQGSSHPLAAAVLAAAREHKLSLAAASDYLTLPGHGARAMVNGSNVYAVSPAYARQNLGLAPSVPLADRTLVVLADEQKELGLLEFEDTLRPGAAGIISQLSKMGVQTVMLTGDSHGVAADIPEQKLDHIRALGERGKIMMVGDGINDAPALAAADVGVAMAAAGSDTALESADIALMADDLGQLPFVLRLSRKALATIKLNIWFAILVKLIAVAMVFPGWLTLWLAILADTGAALIVILNSMRLLRAK